MRTHRAELSAMCSGVAWCLKSGGRFVTVNSNPACDFRSAPSYRKYGFETRVVGSFCEGAPITWTFHLEDAPFAIENYFCSFETIRRPSTPPDFATFAGTGHYFRQRAKGPMGR